MIYFLPFDKYPCQNLWPWLPLRAHSPINMGPRVPLKAGVRPPDVVNPESSSPDFRRQHSSPTHAGRLRKQGRAEGFILRVRTVSSFHRVPFGRQTNSFLKRSKTNHTLPKRIFSKKKKSKLIRLYLCFTV